MSNTPSVSSGITAARTNAVLEEIVTEYYQQNKIINNIES
jgi:hypothetical protein